MLVIISSPSKGGYYASAVAAPVFKEIADKVYSTRPDMQPDIREQFPQLAMSLPPVAGGDASEIATVYKQLRIPFSKNRSEEHTSELQSLMRISYAVFCLK